MITGNAIGATTQLKKFTIPHETWKNEVKIAFYHAETRGWQTIKGGWKGQTWLGEQATQEYLSTDIRKEYLKVQQHPQVDGGMSGFFEYDQKSSKTVSDFLLQVNQDNQFSIAAIEEKGSQKTSRYWYLHK